MLLRGIWHHDTGVAINNNPNLGTNHVANCKVFRFLLLISVNESSRIAVANALLFTACYVLISYKSLPALIPPLTI